MNGSPESLELLVKLLDRVLPDTSREGFEAVLIRLFFLYNDREFRLSSIGQTFVKIAAAAEASAVSNKFVCQLAIKNSIVVFVLEKGAIPEPCEVSHSINGFDFADIPCVAVLTSGNWSARAYFRLVEVKLGPSVVRVQPDLQIINNDWWFCPEYMLALSAPPRKSQGSRGQAKAQVPKIQQGLSIEIGIPVWNSPNHFVRLFDDLARTLDGFESVTISILDDQSEDHSRRILDETVERFRQAVKQKVRVGRNKKNLGFIGTVNQLFAVSQADVFVLMTTDVCLPPRWLERLLAPLNDERAALVTPFAVNGANLDVKLPAGCSWLDLDEAAQHLPPTYPDAETNVGYCLAVRKKALGASAALFSDAFENGYGDDSDLYYRVVASGYRGVVADNLVVYHAGGGSFALLESVDALREKNFTVFMNRWGSVYGQRARESCSLIAATAKRVEERARSHRNPVDGGVLFVLPTANRSFGGVEAVHKIVEGLRDRRASADILVLREPPTAPAAQSMYRADTLSSASIIERGLMPNVVVATSHDTVAWVLSLSKAFGSRCWYFVQGPEMAFGGGRYARSVLEQMKSFERVLCVSEYLREMMKELGDVDAEVIPYGPNTLEFFSLDKPRKKAVAIQYAGRSEKGSDLAGIAVPSLLKAGFDVTAFGTETFPMDVPVGVTKAGHLTPVALRKLFQSVEFYVDLSRYEGLGMLTLEATFCGAVPIVMRNGGAAREIDRLGAGIPIHAVDELHSLGPRLLAERNDLSRFSAGRMQVMSRFNLGNALGTFIEKLNG